MATATSLPDQGPLSAACVNQSTGPPSDFTLSLLPPRQGQLKSTPPITTLNNITTLTRPWSAAIPIYPVLSVVTQTGLSKRGFFLLLLLTFKKQF